MMFISRAARRRGSVPIREEEIMIRERLMTTPPQFALSRLSRQGYVDFLAKAKARGFSFVRFDDFLPGRPPLPERYIVLRHDIDFAPVYSLQMAELEHEAGVASTFFVLADGQFYNPLQKDVIAQLRRIHALGHEIGLHFAVSSAVEPDIGREVALRLEILSALTGAAVRSFSQHDPVNAGFASVSLPQGHGACVDASAVIRDHGLLYVSDSAMMWRRYTFDTALDEVRNLCLLAHPHSWLHPQDDYVAMIRDLEAREVQALTDRFDAFVDALSGYYARRLAEGV
jgi:hypothetical protein